MKNPLLEIGLEHYVIILMWIPLLIHDIVLKQSKGFKLFVIAAFFLPWVSIISQVGLKVLYMFLNGESSNCYIFAKFWWCLYPTIIFNTLHLISLFVLLGAARIIVRARLQELPKKSK